ncbi:MAG TPA: DUF1376 domain-containing protein [Xanthobacteraceae bacterium]|nr:DUF1376 domain-containing protein [Xanthobacteraceae bacterium]
MSRPWFPFYVGDYVKDTARLTTEAHGAYLLLMLDYWTRGAPPDNDEVLATITKLPVKTWRTKVRPLLLDFFSVEDGKWTHRRIEEEIARSQEVATSNSEKARQAAQKRWAKNKPKESPADAPSISQELPQNAQSQSQSPIVAVDDAHAPARGPSKSTFKPEHFDLTERILEAQRLTMDDLQAVGTTYFAQKWIDQGWQPDVILATIQRVMSKRNSAPNTPKYFEQAIADAHAELARPLPVGTVRSGSGPPRRQSIAELAIEMERDLNQRGSHEQLTYDE